MPDTLDDPRRAAGILSLFGQPAGVAPTPEQLDRIHGLRGDLMAVATADTRSRTTRGWKNLTGNICDLTFQQVFSPSGQPELRQLSGDPIVGRIVRTVVELIATGAWTRVRVCANEDCAHVFYDATRSRTRRWHSYEICGNRTNVAAYRARSKKTPGTD